jgi:hypothetical protein
MKSSNNNLPFLAKGTGKEHPKEIEHLGNNYSTQDRHHKKTMDLSPHKPAKGQ